MDAKAEKNLIEGTTGPWEVVIGMEVHAQVTSNAKLFSGASTEFGGEPNSHVSLVDAAMPGMLPVINEGCIAQAIRTGLGLKAKINLTSIFDRKNYFYPDLPQGYQISQYKSPVVGEGEVIVDLLGGERVTVGIERLHLEQDAGKSLHDQHPQYSYVDLNRSGVALMEIVSKPDLRSSEQARAYVSKLRTILRYLGTCDGNMEEGSLRADVNVSVRRPGEPLGTRCEIKNVNSIRFIGQAIEHEARRQIEILEDGGSIHQETRLFDAKTGETRSMRSKEEAHDYRYFPDPDLLPLELTQDYVDRLAKDLPELPDAKRARFIADYGLSPYDADVLIAEKESADYFESAAKGRDAKQAANWVVNELFGRLNKEGRSIADSPCTADQLGAILDLIKAGTISGKIAKDVFDIVWTEGGEPAAIVEARGLTQVTDMGAIEQAVDQVIAANPDKVEQAKAKPALDRLVRRPGDEGDGRQGQSASGERSAQDKARDRMSYAIRVHEYGGPEVLKWEKVEVGDPGPGEIKIRQTAVGLNFIDVYQRSGLYPQPSFPFIPGMEGAGEVTALGEGVRDLKVGRHVAYAGPIGAYAEERLIAADRVVKIPAGVDDKIAAAIMLKGMTAQYLLRRTYKVGRDTTLLFHAAAGGVGLIACQWAASLGATVIGTVGSSGKALIARAHGCTHVINIREEDLVAKVKEYTKGNGVDVVYDSIGKDTFPASLDCLKPLGLWVSFGQSSGPVPPFKITLLSQKGSLFATRPSIIDYTRSRKDLVATANDLFEVIAKGKVKVAVNQTYALADAADAQRDLEARLTTGSTVLLA